ncbi:hypothetical protein EZV62_003968 [Acer yangbiense]|uniref:Disease resistance N-terminal domain-containing protein n=1 Tax=Acer yangbiense TaxID=1000413 RepID=A0A5C7IIG5_9ROSI|nr:hypothetical protein EZV62_003968 [Acer yangbiense]
MQLCRLFHKKLREEVRLVTGVRKEINKLTSNFRAIQDVRGWLDQLKDASYDMDDVLDEWNTAILNLQGGEVGQNALVPKKKLNFAVQKFRLLIRLLDVEAPSSLLLDKWIGLAIENNVKELDFTFHCRRDREPLLYTLPRSTLLYTLLQSIYSY